MLLKFNHMMWGQGNTSRALRGGDKESTAGEEEDEALILKQTEEATMD